MAQFRLEKGIPIPPTPQRRRDYFGYPWRQMEPGDSFFVPTDDPDAAAKRKESILGSMRGAQNRLDDWAFPIRAAAVIEKGSFGVRVWRLK